MVDATLKKGRFLKEEPFLCLFHIDKVDTVSSNIFVMDGGFCLRAFLIFCISCTPLWGIEGGEEPTDNLESLERFMLMTIFTWNDNVPAFLGTRVREKIQNERNPLLPNELKEGGWEYIQARLRKVRAKFFRSIEEVDSLMRLVQVIQDAPRPEGSLDFEADDYCLLRALRDHLMDTIPRPGNLAGY
jgi:hypothetical protein